MFSNKAVANAGLSGKPMSKTFAQIEKPYSSSPRLTTLSTAFTIFLFSHKIKR